MELNRSVQQAVRFAIAAVATASAPTLQAQTAPEPATAMTEVVVTGTRLKVANDAAVSPITTVTAGDIQATGMTRVEDVLNNLPQVFAAQGSTVSNGSDGTATVNLRNLGSVRTLVLVNGRRLGPGSSAGGSASDLNQIPAALVERIDIFTGGASSVYGADAVAGVVNFVLNTKFEGVKVDANYSFNNHKQGNSAIQALVKSRGFALPDDTVNTGYGRDFSVLMGANFADGKGNATVYGTYRRDDSVLQAKYDYSACTLNSPTASGLAAGRGLACGGSGTSATGYFQAYGNSGAALFTKTVDKATGAFRDFSAATDLFNFGPLNYYQRPDERYTGGVFLNFDVNDHVNTYAEVGFTRNTSVAQIAPSGDFFLLSSIPCNNPLLTAEQRSTICSPANLAAQGQTDHMDLYIGRRNVEGGGRQATFDTSGNRAILGVRGKINDHWDYDVYGQYVQGTGSFGNLNYLSNARIQNALNVVPDPVTGAPVCQSVLNGTDKKCVPWNIWVPGGVTAAATSYLAIPLLVDGNLTERVVSGSATGDLGAYGMKLPWAATGLQLNVGAEWRSERSNYNPDLASQLGDAAGSGGPTVPVSGGYNVKELFTEMRLPLVANKTGAQGLDFEAGYRYSDYSLGFNTDTYKAGLEWSPVQDIRLRGSYQRAVRAPNVSELFSPQSVGLDGTNDPCAGTAPAFSAAQCARSGVTALQYGNIAPNPAAQYNALLGGNPGLQPEVADTTSFGFVFQPTFVNNLVLSADYYNIKIKETIGVIGENNILTQCVTTGSPIYCNAIHRSATGSLWKSTDGFVVDTNVNVGSIGAKGVDVKGRYKLGMNRYGSLTFNLEGSRSIKGTVQPLTGGPEYDCVGFAGAQCGVPQPKWRHTLTNTWATPWTGLDLTLRWRYFGKAASERTSSDPQLKATFFPGTAFYPAFNYLDVSAAWSMKNSLKLRLGVNNVTDKDPPIVPSGSFSDCPTTQCNGNSYAQVYDTLGRFVYAHVSAQF